MTEVTYILSGLGLFLLGFGASQLAFTIKLSSQIRVNKTEINGLKDDLLTEKKNTNQRFTDTIKLFEKMLENNGNVIRQNTVLIAELKAKK